MSDKHTVVGVLSGITRKPTGWSVIEVAVPGKQYPLKLDTKLDKLIEAAEAVGTNPAEWTYSETDSGTPNPHNPGTNYVNRRLEGVGPISLENAEQADVFSGSGENDRMTKEDWAQKDSAIHKMACIKAASKALTHTIPAQPTLEDLNIFLDHVAHLSIAWHRVVLAVRDDPNDDDIPF